MNYLVLQSHAEIRYSINLCLHFDKAVLDLECVAHEVVQIVVWEIMDLYICGVDAGFCVVLDVRQSGLEVTNFSDDLGDDDGVCGIRVLFQLGDTYR